MGKCTILRQRSTGPNKQRGDPCGIDTGRFELCHRHRVIVKKKKCENEKRKSMLSKLLKCSDIIELSNNQTNLRTRQAVLALLSMRFKY